jgi:hypothetical protein
MVHEPNHEEATRVAFETAVSALPPLTRVIFLLHRVDGLSYGAIARRLSIGALAVESGLADAIYRICSTLNGGTPKRAIPDPLADANALLSQRHRRYCELRLHALGITAPVTWRDNDGADDTDGSVMLAMLLSMTPAVLQTFVFSQTENLTHAQIGLRVGTCNWIVRWRLLQAGRHIAQCPASFEHWLRQI